MRAALQGWPEQLGLCTTLSQFSRFFLNFSRSLTYMSTIFGLLMPGGKGVIADSDSVDSLAAYLDILCS